ncbi:MAG: hypothetical protein WCR54_08230 [Clostridia bacterium]
MSDTQNQIGTIAFALALIIQCDDKIVELQSTIDNLNTNLTNQEKINDSFATRLTDIETTLSKIK